MTAVAATETDLVYKILLLGDSEVGKSCFLMRYADNVFVDNYITTIGLDYKLKYIQLDSGEIIKVQLWDTAGQDRYRTIAKNYYKGSHGILLLYDVTKTNSIENIRQWIRDIREEVYEKAYKTASFGSIPQTNSFNLIVLTFSPFIFNTAKLSMLCLLTY